MSATEWLDCVGALIDGDWEQVSIESCRMQIRIVDNERWQLRGGPFTFTAIKTCYAFLGVRAPWHDNFKEGLRFDIGPIVYADETTIHQ